MSYPTPRTQGHSINNEMTDVIVDWLEEVLGIEAPCPHPILWQKRDPWEFARDRSL